MGVRGLRNEDDSIAPLTTVDRASPISSGRNSRVNGVVRRVVLMEESTLFQVTVSLRRRVVKPKVRVVALGR